MAAVLLNPRLCSNCSRFLRRPKPIGNSHGKWPPWSRARTEVWKTGGGEQKRLKSKHLSIVRAAEISTPLLHHHTLTTPCWLRTSCSPRLCWHRDEFILICVTYTTSNNQDRGPHGQAQSIIIVHNVHPFFGHWTDVESSGARSLLQKPWEILTPHD